MAPVRAYSAGDMLSGRDAVLRLWANVETVFRRSGMKKTELAKRLGLELSYVSSFQNPRPTQGLPGLEVVIGLSRELKLRIDDVVCGIDTEYDAIAQQIAKGHLLADGLSDKTFPTQEGSEMQTIGVTAAEMQMIGAVRGLRKSQHHGFARAVSALAESWASGRSKSRRSVQP